MGFKAVWGCDPEEAIKEQQAFQLALAGTNVAYEDEFDELTCATFATDAQIYELRRLFRL